MTRHDMPDNDPNAGANPDPDVGPNADPPPPEDPWSIPPPPPVGWGGTPGTPPVVVPPWSLQPPPPAPPYEDEAESGQPYAEETPSNPWHIPPQPRWDPATEPPPTERRTVTDAPADKAPGRDAPASEGRTSPAYRPVPPPTVPVRRPAADATTFDLPPSATSPRSMPRPPEKPPADGPGPRPPAGPPGVYDEPWRREAAQRGGGTGIRLRTILIGIAGLVVAGLIATGIVVLSTRGSSHTPSEPAARLADAVFARDPAAKTDGLDQELLNVATSGSVVVAVGGEYNTGYRGEFFVSTDGGRSFTLADVHTSDGQEPPYGDVPRQVAGTTGSWVALGTSPGGTVVWTSRDGKSWTRESDDAGSAFNRPDRIGRIVRTSSGFVAVGDTSAKGDYSDASPVVWLSSDGRHWERRPAEQLGISAAKGSLSLIDAAAVGNLVLAHGWNNVGKAHPDDLTWRSIDGGRTWEPVSVPTPKNASGLGVTATPSGFVAVRNVAGGTKKPVFTGTVLSSPDAKQWTPIGSIQVPGYDGVQRLAGSDRGLAALVSTGKQLTIVRSTDGRSWTPAGTIPAAQGRSVLGLAVTASATITVGRDSSADGNDALLQVRDAQGQDVPVDLSRVPGGERSDLAISALASGRDLTLAVGSANGDGSIWVSRNGRGWSRASAAGGVLTRPGRQRLLSAVQGGAGWLAVGYDGIAPKRALVVTSTDGTTWQAADGDAAFAASHGGQSLTSAAAAGNGGYVVVGADGPSAAAWYSADLKTWHRGGEAERGDLGGKPEAPRWMADVAGGPFGYVAAGGLNDPTAGTTADGRPVIWTSADGKAWRLQQLPLPSGTIDATFTHVAARGSQLLATGTAKTASGSTVFAYTSADGGKSWQQLRLPGADGVAGMALTTLTSTPKGFVVAGGGGHGGRSDVYLWTSADGRTWKLDRPQGLGLSGRGDQWLTALTTSGADLLAAGVTADHRGEQPTLWRRPLP